MKRDVPLVLKYFAIVGISCFLAYVTSRSIASAQALTPVAVPKVTVADQVDYAVPGTHKVETSLSIWKDASRTRQVPVKLYFPITTAANADAAKFPVILFSHGLGGNREGGKI